ncbi:MAG: bifunctional metallophosphatase/5'-nucleotidase [Candidatus Melainabacteria bacterium]|nr:bifunctional metallophosphatase/5'-nucleotidase [Candidatus Melainabacteria bacterium]
MQNDKDPKNNLKVRPFLKLALIALSLLVIAHVSAVTSVTRAADEELHFTILHTNDLHSHAEPFSERGRIVGGMARLGHLIHSIKANTPNTVVIDAGDMFQGTPLFTHYHGDVEVSLLNHIGYDIYTIGNHEFDDGAENLGHQLKKAKFDVICSNLDVDAQPDLKSVVKPYVIREINGQKVGFVGVMTPELERLSLSLGGVKVKNLKDDWLIPVRQAVKELEGKGVNHIVAVTHCGADLDQQISQAIPQIDVIIGGHSHTRLDKALFVEHDDSSKTIIVQTGSYGRTLGRLDVAFNKDGSLDVADTKYRLINITDKIQEHPEMKAYIDKKVEPLLPLRRTIVSQAEDAFDNRWTAYPWDSALGDLITDALCEAGKSYGTTISVHNRGGMRGRIEKGPISLEKVQEILPFDNRLTFATITGKALLSALEHSVSGPVGGRFLDVHGLKLGYDPTRKRGERLVFALAENKDGSYSAIDETQEYKVAINNYTFQAGEGYDFKDAKNVVNTPERVGIPFRQYLEARPSVKPQAPSRIVPITENILSAMRKDKVIAKISNVPPNSRISLYSGTGRGITPVANNIPVPLEKPLQEAGSLSADEQGKCVWKGSVGGSWMCAVVQPPKGTKPRKLIFSYPIEIKASKN